MRKHLNWPIFAKSSKRLRDRPWQTDLLFLPKLNGKAREKHNSCSCFLLLSRAIYMLNYFNFVYHSSCFIKVSFNLKIVDIDGFPLLGSPYVY